MQRSLRTPAALASARTPTIAIDLAVRARPATALEAGLIWAMAESHVAALTILAEAERARPALTEMALARLDLVTAHGVTRACNAYQRALTAYLKLGQLAPHDCRLIIESERAAAAPEPPPSEEPAPAPQPKPIGLGRLKNGNRAGDYRAAPRCGARTRAGHACRQPAMAGARPPLRANGRCRFHGGKSTGPTSAAGRTRCAAARLVHGGRTRTTRVIRALARRAAHALAAGAAEAQEMQPNRPRTPCPAENEPRQGRASPPLPQAGTAVAMVDSFGRLGLTGWARFVTPVAKDLIIELPNINERITAEVCGSRDQ